jgi:hypothetical protein
MTKNIKTQLDQVQLELQKSYLESSKLQNELIKVDIEIKKAQLKQLKGVK